MAQSHHSIQHSRQLPRPHLTNGARYLRWGLFEAALNACKHSLYAERVSGWRRSDPDHAPLTGAHSPVGPRQVAEQSMTSTGRSSIFERPAPLDNER